MKFLGAANRPKTRDEGWSPLLMIAALSAAITACSTSIPIPPYMPQPESALIPIPYPPPPARPEIVPKQPNGESVWIDGEWSWRSSRWAWLRGRWVVSPKGAKYAPWASVRAQSGNLYFAAGAWHDQKGIEIPPPPPVAVAGDVLGAVVDAEGNIIETRRILSPPGTPPKP